MNLADLGSTPLNDGVDVANLPEQLGAIRPMLQPGSYRFALPRLDAECFAAVQTQDYGARVQVRFDDEHPLTIVQAPEALKDELLGTPFTTSLSNVPRKRGKGDDAPVASDWDYLNRALKVTTRPASNQAYAQGLIALSQVSPAPTFGADAEVSYNCNPNREARWDDGQGGTQAFPDETTGQPRKGCGTRVYQKDVAKTNGRYPERITCAKCNASVRGFANLTRFRE